jgi:hypothetical protein
MGAAEGLHAITCCKICDPNSLALQDSVALYPVVLCQRPYLVANASFDNTTGHVAAGLT